MTTSTRTRAALACALLATTALASPALAQSSAQPAYRNLDENGVDLTHGDFVLSFLEGSIGSGESELALIRQRVGDEYSNWDGISLFAAKSPTGDHILSVRLGNRLEQFLNGVPKQANGATISAANDGYLYRAADGTAIGFSPIDPDATCTPSSSTSCRFVPDSITTRDGRSVSLVWERFYTCSTQAVDDCRLDDVLLSEVQNSFGYAIRFQYASGSQFQRRSGATFHNDVVSPAALASVSYAYPANGVTEVTDTGGRTWRFTSTSTGLSVRRPGASSDTTVYATTLGGMSGTVTSVLNEGVTTGYSRTVSGSTGTMTLTDAANQQTVVTSDLAIGRPTSVKDPLNRTTSFQYDGSGRLTRLTAPEGNYVQYTLDARGNVTQTQAVAKPGSALPAITTSASYEASCSNPATCNQPNSTTDARGNVTEYSYDGTHGGLLTMTAPASAPGAVRPQTRFGYTLVNGEYQLTSVSGCRTSSSCAGTADEVKSSFAYDSNGNVTGTATGSGDGTLTAAQAMTYDGLGNLLTLDGPLPGSADTTRYRYDAARQLVGTVSADPDGAGALKHRAQRVGYGAYGQVTKAEQGTVNSQSDADWAAFTPLQGIEIDYDANARPVVQKLVAGGTAYELTQASYDVLGRPECSAVRMNPAAYGSLPTSACAVGAQGSFGPDRIVKTVYNAASEVTQVRSAVGTPDEAAEVSSTYTNNGEVQTVTDGENNKTTYEYDGHDRLLKTFYPSPTKGAGTSSTTDYEQLFYDPNGNVTAFQNRAGETMTFLYDNLDRLSEKHRPSPQPNASYTYNLLGWLEQTNETRPYTGTPAANWSGAIRFRYDALGRKIEERSNNHPIVSGYDLAGRRTRITYPGSFYVDQEYLVTGEMTTIRENGATSGVGVLATFGYDDLGRRTSLVRGNGTTTSYSYDPISRLGQATEDLAGTVSDLTSGYSYNPASQIVSTTRSNDKYVWKNDHTGTTSSPANGRNQLTSFGGTSITYDAKGNITFDPTTSLSYTYSADNLLISAAKPYQQPGRLFYDGLDRLFEAGAGPTTLYFNDGSRRIGEYYNGQPSARYVYGPGEDELLVTYSAPNILTPTFQHADERGSILASSQQYGLLESPGLYDEYGKTWSFGSYRHGFAGMAYETVSDLYYARARMYNPRLGRFMQPDPIGYDDGMNIYAYVKGDPVNFIDTFGLDAIVPGYERGWTSTAQTRDRGRGGGFANGGSSYRLLLDTPISGVDGGGGGGGWTNLNLPQQPGADDHPETVIKAKYRYSSRSSIFENVLRWIFSQNKQSRGGFTGGGGSFGGAGASGSWDCGCFEAGTLVATSHGLKPIEQIKVGDLVQAVNEATGEIASKPVTDLIRPEPKPLYALKAVDAGGEAEAFHATADHPWKVEGKGWVETIDLKEGDRIDTGSGADLVVTSLTLTERVERTYNLTVADWHTFMVGENRAVVHNADCYKHNYKYHPRVRQRGIQDPRAHNFPYSFDDKILSQTPIQGRGGSLLYQLPGTLGGNTGVFEIGLNPRTREIFHRTFRGN